MPTPQTIARIEQLIWIFIYVGLFAAIIGMTAFVASPGTAWILIAGGCVLVVAGVILIWVRSRFDEGTIPGKSTSSSKQGRQDR